MLNVTRFYLLMFPEPLLRTNCWHCLHVFLAGFDEAKPRPCARSLSCAVYLGKSLRIVVWPKYLRSTLLAYGHCWEVSASQRFTARVCDFYGYYSELSSISNSHTLEVSCQRLGLRANLQARLSVVQFQKEKFDLYQIIVLISLCGVTF